jgi:hypothetical protein
MSNFRVLGAFKEFALGVINAWKIDKLACIFCITKQNEIKTLSSGNEGVKIKMRHPPPIERTYLEELLNFKWTHEGMLQIFCNPFEAKNCNWQWWSQGDFTSTFLVAIVFIDWKKFVADEDFFFVEIMRIFNVYR